MSSIQEVPLTYAVLEAPLTYSVLEAPPIDAVLGEQLEVTPTDAELEALEESVMRCFTPEQVIGINRVKEEYGILILLHRLLKLLKL